MATFSHNGTSYDIQIAGGVIQTRVVGTSTWDSYAQMGNVQSAYVAFVPGSDRPWITALSVDGNYYSTPLGVFDVQYPSNLANYNEAAGLGVLASILASNSTAPAPTGPVSTFETALSLSGHQIVDVAPGVAPSDVVVVSQLNGLSAALTTVINAKDAVKASEIAALQAEIDNLPAGLEMSTVQAAINASVAQAVLNEVIDDAQREAIVDAVLAQLSTIDTAVIGRVGAAEAIIASLQARVAAIEAKDAVQDAAIAALEAKDALQDAAISAAAVAAQAAIAVNASQDAAIGQVYTNVQSLAQAITPVVVKIRNGLVDAATTGISLSSASIDNVSADHMQVTVDLTGNSHGKGRSVIVHRLFGSVRQKIGVQEITDSTEKIYSVICMKNREGSTDLDVTLS